MPRFVRILWAVTALSLFVPVPGSAQKSERHAYVTVLDSDGTPVSGLTKEHFAVREDGRDRDVVGVQPLDTPMHVAVLVDLSFSPRLPIDAVRSAVGDFVERLAGFHHVALYGIAERPTPLVPFTRDVQKLRSAVAGLFARPESRTFLIDTVHEALRDLKPLEPARPMIVAFTTENVESSARTAVAVMKQLVAAQTPFHAIQLSTATGADDASRVMPDRNIPGRSQQLGKAAAIGEGDRERNRLLEQGTKLTGGSAQRLTTLTTLAAPLHKLASEFAYSYRLTFAGPPADRPLKDLQIGLMVEGVTVRAAAARRGRLRHLS